MGRLRDRWTVRLAMAAGFVIGLWLLAQLRPSPIVDAPPTVDRARPERAEAPRPSLAPVERTAPHSPSPPLEEAVEEEAAWAEPTDTAVDAVTVTVVLEDADGYAVDGRPFVVGCPIEGWQREAAGEFALVIPYGALCTAWAQKRDGLLMARTDRIEFDATPGTEIVLVFPAERTGGIGIRFQPMGSYVEVVDVLPGTPAYEAGLVPGDRITAVGGVPVTELDTEGFVDEMTGPEGSEVEFELEIDGDTGLSISTVGLTRAFLSG